MAQPLKKAQPGDIITAEDWNLVVDAINELLQSGQTSGIKVAALLPGGTVIDPIRVGTIQQITGQNFGFSIGQSKVTFEAGTTIATILRAQMLAGSFDERLLFIMPPVPGITPAGLNMTMRVSNGVAEDTRSVFVMPVVIDLTGDMFVTFRADSRRTHNPIRSKAAPENLPSFAIDFRLESISRRRSLLAPRFLMRAWGCPPVSSARSNFVTSQTL